MIAAIWSADGQKDIESTLARIERSFGRPVLVDQRGSGALLGWSTSAKPFAHVDAGLTVGRFERSPRARGPFDGGESLTGNFALVGWHRGGTILVARSLFGGEPLYWGRDGARAIAASRIDILLAALDAPVAFDHDQLAVSILGFTPPAGRLADTPYAAIRRVLPGERFVLGSSNVGKTIWTNVQIDDALTGDADANADALWEASKDAVRRAMSGARVIGVLAGGGVDSSGLLAAAASVARELGNVTVVPLALDFAGEGDDRPHLRALESALGLTALRTAPEAASAHAERGLVVGELPSLLPSIPLVCAAIETGKKYGVERVLSGFLGDLVLDAPPTALLQRMVARDPLSPLDAIRAATQFQAPWTSTPLSRVREMLLHPLLRRALPSSLIQWRRRARLRSIVPWMGPRMTAMAGELARDPLDSEPLVTTPYERYRTLATNVQMADQIEARAQLEELTGIPFVEPWMDDEMCRFLARIPPWMLAHGDRDRGLFRHSLRGRVPDSIRLRRDKARIEPALDRMLPSGPMRDRLRALGRGTELARNGIVDADGFRRATDLFFAPSSTDVSEAQRDDDGATWTALWPALAAEALLERASGS